MGRQKGIIRIHGQVGGLVFYKLNGKDVVRAGSGPSKEQIQHGENFARTRENNMEFGGASAVSKSFRTVFAAALHKHTTDPLFTARLVRIFKTINARASWGERGQRPFLVSENHSMLLSLEFNERFPLKQVLKVFYTTTHHADRNAAVIDLPAFVPRNSMVIPAGATHYELVSLLGVLSDHIFDVNVLRYQEQESVAQTLRTLFRTGLLDVETTTGPIQMPTALPGSPALGAHLSVIQTLGVVFYQRAGGIDYVLEQGNTMGIVQVF